MLIQVCIYWTSDFNTLLFQIMIPVINTDLSYSSNQMIDIHEVTQLFRNHKHFLTNPLPLIGVDYNPSKPSAPPQLP